MVLYSIKLDKKLYQQLKKRFPDVEFPEIKSDDMERYVTEEEAMEASATGCAKFSYPYNMHWDDIELPCQVISYTIEVAYSGSEIPSKLLNRYS